MQIDKRLYAERSEAEKFGVFLRNKCNQVKQDNPPGHLIWQVLKVTRPMGFLPDIVRRTGIKSHSDLRTDLTS